MITDHLFGGGKKFRHLFLVQPDFAILCIQGHRSLSVYGVVDDDVALFVGNGGVHGYTEFKIFARLLR